MKLCLASVSCVIENRLESEDNELERRLIRGQRPSSSSRSDAETAPSGGRPPPAPAPSLPPAAEAAAPTLPVTRSSTSGPNRPATPGPPCDDLPLSHTWHGGGGPNTAAGTNAEDEASVGGGAAGGGTSGRFGTHTGSRANLLKGSRRWGTSKGSRVLDGDGLHAVGEDAPVGAPTGTGTPTKSVKFVLGRKRTENGGLSSAAVAAAAPGGKPGAARAGGASSKPAAQGVGNAAAGQAADPRAAVMNVTVQTRLWAEYFNNTLRCWEALLDPFR